MKTPKLAKMRKQLAEAKERLLKMRKITAAKIREEKFKPAPAEKIREPFKAKLEKKYKKIVPKFRETWPEKGKRIAEETKRAYDKARGEAYARLRGKKEEERKRLKAKIVAARKIREKLPEKITLKEKLKFLPSAMKETLQKGKWLPLYQKRIKKGMKTGLSREEASKKLIMEELKRGKPLYFVGKKLTDTIEAIYKKLR